MTDTPKTTKAKGTATVDETVAGASAGGSGAESGEAARGAVAGSVGTGLDARMAGGGLDLGQDISQTERTTVDLHTDSNMWTLNKKRAVANELDYDQDHRTIRLRRERNAEDHDQQLRNLAVQSLQNAVQGHNRRNNIASTIDAQSLGENAVFQDAISAGVAQGFNAMIPMIVTAIKEAVASTKE